MSDGWDEFIERNPMQIGEEQEFRDWLLAGNEQPEDLELETLEERYDEFKEEE